jgi:hypothetical protein
MATHDYIISNASGAAVRADLNNALAAIATNNSSATAPTTTYAYQWWADTGSSPTVMKLRNAANSAWITLFQLDGEWSLIPFENGTAAAPSIYFKDSGTDTGIFSPGTDQVGISAGGTSRFEVSTTATTSTLPVVHPLGAVGTPSITFTGDLNTGVYSPGADQVAISTNGTQRLTVDTAATTSTLPVVHPLGAVGTPSITFTGDLNTGIYSPAADTIAFVEGGAEAMRIDSSGRVGIGTTSPSVKFEVSGAASSNPEIRVVDGTVNTQWYASNVGECVFGTFSNHPQVFRTNGAERMRITNTGETRITGGGTGTNQALFVQNSTPSRLLGVREDGYTQWGVATNSPYNFGVSSATKAMFMDSSGGFGFNSSIRAAKTNIELAPSAGWIGNLDVVTFNYRFKNQAGDYSDDYSDELRWGVIADDAETVCPDFCSYDSEGKLDGFHYDRLVPVLLKALQESNKRIETLEAEVAALKAS